MAYRIGFFLTPSGRNPVKDYIENAPQDDQGDIINTIDLLEDLGFDLLETKFMRKISPAIFELRIKSQQLHRVLLFFHTEAGFVLVHAFTKQSDKTPRKEIQTAEKRMAAWLATQHQAKARGR